MVVSEWEFWMTSLEGGGNAIILLLTAMVVAAAVLGAIIAVRRKRRTSARNLAMGAALVSLVYAGGVAVASATSQERVLAPGETKWFCGFYIDCHLGASVQRTETATAVTGPAGRLTADGRFHIITLRLHNSAKNPSLDMMMYRPRVEIVDASGKRYRRSEAAESAFAADKRPAPLAVETRVPHEPVDATVVFDLPADIRSPRLSISEGWLVDRIIELGLVNDENSILHKRTYIALDSNDLRAAMR